MRTIIAGLLSAGLLAAVPCAAGADPARDFNSYAKMYPSATPRQLKNVRAYERGQYYEQLSDAVPFGSRVWWELKDREKY
jgi:Tfp pilus assembly protein PilP